MKLRVARLPVTAALAAALVAAAPAAAGEIEKMVAFELDQWIDLGAADGPVTLHRARLARQSGLTKSKFMRPGNSQYLQDVQLQIEFTNDATKDWEARVKVEWVDSAGAVIDGYDDTETLDSESRHDEQTITLSTLRYGLDRAKRLKLRIEFHPD